MCTNYIPTARDRFKALRLGVAHLPTADWPPEVFPGYEAPIVVQSAEPAAGNGGLQVQMAKFGLVPRWSRDVAHGLSISKGTYNARTETVAEKPSFRTPWRERHYALAPMECYFDPNWEEAHLNGGKAVRWRISRADGDPFACAALWERWNDKLTGEIITSFTLLTVNADGHALCGRLHRPGDEKRMPVIIAANDCEAWLNATPEQAHSFMRTTPAELLIGEPAPVPSRSARSLKIPVNHSLF